MPQPNLAQEQRQRLLSGLARALEAAPLPMISIATIVREAQASKRAFYQHFQNKEQCFLALYASNSERILAILQQAVAGQHASWEERIRSGTRAYLTAMQQQAVLMRRLYMDILGLSAEGARVRRHVNQRFADLLIGLYGEQRRTLHDLPKLDERVVLAVIAGLNELILYKIEDGEVDSLLSLSEPTDLLMKGLLSAALANRV